MLGGRGGGVYEVIMDNVKMVNLKISGVEEIQYQIDTIQFIALKSASCHFVLSRCSSAEGHNVRAE